MQGIHSIKKLVTTIILAAVFGLLALASIPAAAQTGELVATVLPLAVTGEETSLIKDLMSTLKGKKDEPADTMGEEFSLLLTQELSETHGIPLVERAELNKALSEMELGESGLVEPGTAARIGHLTGAKAIITGRMFQVQSNMVVVTKVIGVETGRVFSQTVTIPKRGSVTEAATLLAAKVADVLTTSGSHLVATSDTEQDPIQKLQAKLVNYDTNDFPIISISIDEMSMSQRTLDPASETELGTIMQGVGFQLVDPVSASSPPDVQIEGEAFSEFGLRKGNLVSSKGRVEVKAIERTTGKILAIDRAVVVAVDLSPEMAGKKALQNATAQLSERFVPAMLKKLNTKTH